MRSWKTTWAGFLKAGVLITAGLITYLSTDLSSSGIPHLAEYGPTILMVATILYGALTAASGKVAQDRHPEPPPGSSRDGA